MIKNQLGQTIGAQMTAAATGAPFTGTVSVLVTIDAGIQTPGAGGACVHEGNGYFTYHPTQAETNGDLIAFTFTGGGAITATLQVYTVSAGGYALLAPSVGGGGGIVTSALSLITRALRVIGEVAGEEVPTAAQAQDGLEHLQDLMDALKTQRFMIPSLLRTVQSLAAFTQSYTIGAGGAINIVRPETIEWARLVQDTNAPIPLEVPLELLTDERWAKIPQKNQLGMAEALYYDYAWTAGLGKLYLFPVPQTGTTSLVLYTPVAFPEFASLQAAYTFPPGWNRVLRLKLAKALAPEYGRGFPSDEELAEAWADVKRVNQRPRELKNSYPDCERAGLYNILTDH